MNDEDLRLSSVSYVVLGLLRWLGASTPYNLKRFIEQSVENFWPVPHTTFYAEPARLARAGYLSERQEPGGRRRKLYSLTEKGSDALDAWVRSPEVAPPQLRDEAMLKIFMGADPVAILGPRRDWHEAKLEELRGYLGKVDAAGGPEGVRLALVAGIRYHELLLGTIGGFLEGRRGQPGAPVPG